MARRRPPSPLDLVSQGGRPLVVAHRGGRYPEVAGEQTLEHFARAIALGVDLIEVDLRETQDRQIICCHDPEYAGRVVAQTCFEDLAAAARRAGLPVPPRLDELLQVAKGRVGLDIEIKVAGFEERVIDRLRGEYAPSQVILKSFDDWVVRRLKAVGPDYCSGLLVGVGRPRLGLLGRLPELFPELRLRLCRGDFISPHWQLVRFGFVARMRRLGYPVLVWTLNEKPLLARFLRQAEAVITDVPELALQLRSAAGAG